MKNKKTYKNIIIFILVVIAGIFYYKQGIYADGHENTSPVYVEENSEFTSLAPTVTLAVMVSPAVVNDAKNASAVSDSAEVTEEEMIFVHVCGAVKESGVYEMQKGSRVIDAVTLAGGFEKTAAKDVVNQAQELSDGVRLYIPTIDELKEEDSLAPEYITYGSNQSDSIDRNIAGNEDGVGAKVNINTADKELLMTLQGIGEAKAQSIISYREVHGEFKKIEELCNISGIKDAVYSKIKDYITVSD